jgi:hypothetical protein
MDCAFDDTAFDPVAFDTFAQDQGEGGNQPLFSWQRPALRPVYRRDLLEDEEIIIL